MPCYIHLLANWNSLELQTWNLLFFKTPRGPVTGRASIFRSGLEACSNKNSNSNPVSAKCRLQTADRVQNADWEFMLFFLLIRDNMSSYNLQSITQSLFRDHFSLLFALMWNITCPFLDHNRSLYNFEPSCSLLTLRASWLVWCPYRIYQLNKSSTWSRRFIFLIDMCSFCWQKCGPRPNLFLRLDIFSTFRGVHKQILTYVPYIVIGLHEEPGPRALWFTDKRTSITPKIII